MAFPQGINFRGSLAFVTDTDPNEFSARNTLYPTTTARGNTVGWEQELDSGADADSGIDERLAGYVFHSGSGTHDYRFDLPSAGTYTMRCAVGGANTFLSSKLTILDTSSLVATFCTGVSATGQFKDTTDTNYDSATWPGSNSPADVDFSTTICRCRFGDGSSSADGVAHLFIDSGAETPVLMGQAVM